ncbi:MAG TPA: ubiquinone/menaquinone biosynthesis methyltransferase [Vicinamibacterales bacterium]|nr:ubiquinone/menaquinone biosynthesis methyltransferase [Vicinamibacterales bacterium]
MALREAISTPDGKRTYVRRLFATIADRYDLITVVLSYGQDRRWKRRLVALAGPCEGVRAVDLASGTGDIAFALADAGADVVGIDVTLRMIQIAAAKARTRVHPPAFLVGDMLALPLAAGSFDVVTAGYGLRNVPDLRASIGEIHRVLKPGGLMLSLDFNKPSNAIVRAVYLAYLNVTGAVLGWLLHRDPDTYRYIPASIRNYPGAIGVARMFEAQGFDKVEWRPLLGGLMAIHIARKKT